MDYFCPYCGKKIFWDEIKKLFYCKNCDILVEEIDSMVLGIDKPNDLSYLDCL